MRRLDCISNLKSQISNWIVRFPKSLESSAQEWPNTFGKFSMIDRKICSASRPLVLCLISATLGCSEFGGGAGVVPDVTFVPADAAAAPTDGGGDAAGASTDASAPTGAAGTFSGKVVLTGTAPTLAPTVRLGADIKDKEVCAAIEMADERLLVGEGNGVANVFVFLPRAPKGGKALEASTEPLMFDQKNCRFTPHCLIVPVGREVRVLSDDPIAHNTHTYPKKQDGINTGVTPMDRVGEKVRFQYKKSEGAPYTVMCDFHTWMIAYHLVLDHPYAALTDASGAFTIPDLPPGKHVFMVWHEAADGGFVERKLTVEIKPGEATEQQIEYSSGKLKLK